MNIKGKYDCSTKDSMKTLLSKLRSSRREKRVYVTSRLLTVIYKKIGLTDNEKLELESMLNLARFGKVPLADWLPRGYQIARFHLCIKEHDRSSWNRPTQRDIKLIREAASYYKTLRDRHCKRQLKSFEGTCKCIGVII